MHAWLEALHQLQQEGTACVLVTVAGARGSTPREAGCKMVVTRDALFGTIGGGNLEFVCIDAARDLLDHAAVPILRDFPLGPALGQCCGGHVTVLFEPIHPAARSLALFGAGHVGRAVVHVLDGLPLRVVWVDPRSEAFPPRCPANVGAVIAPDPAAEVARLAPGTLLLVMTHDHQLDFAIVAAALRRDDLPFVGLIGSATKRARFLRRLRQAGLDEAAISRLVCPIGLPGINGKQPAAIAVSVAAQLLRLSDTACAATASDERASPSASQTDPCGDCAAPCRTPETTA